MKIQERGYRENLNIKYRMATGGGKLQGSDRYALSNLRDEGGEIL